MSLESVNADYLRSLTGVGGLYTLASLSKAGLLDAYYSNIIALYEATQGGALMYGSAATASFALTAGVPILRSGSGLRSVQVTTKPGKKPKRPRQCQVFLRVL